MYLLARTAIAFCLDVNVYCYRRVSDAHRLGIEADKITDIDGLVKNNLAHCDRYETLDLRASMRLDGARRVYVRENHAAEDSSLGVSIMRHHANANCRIGVHVRLTQIRGNQYRLASLRFKLFIYPVGDGAFHFIQPTFKEMVGIIDDHQAHVGLCG